MDTDVSDQNESICSESKDGFEGSNIFQVDSTQIYSCEPLTPLKTTLKWSLLEKFLELSRGKEEEDYYDECFHYQEENGSTNYKYPTWERFETVHTDIWYLSKTQNKNEYINNESELFSRQIERTRKKKKLKRCKLVPGFIESSLKKTSTINVRTMLYYMKYQRNHNPF
jgi:hypothetical protein